eukprot:6175190-Pleurochrysis_carterae.AAC.3
MFEYKMLLISARSSCRSVVPFPPAQGSTLALEESPFIKYVRGALGGELLLSLPVHNERLNARPDCQRTACGFSGECYWYYCTSYILPGSAKAKSASVHPHAKFRS